jgi:hypothetical protein
MCSVGPPPTEAGFLTWLQQVVGFTTSVLPADSIYIDIAFNASISKVYCLIQCVDPYQYMLAVYNLGTSFIINMVQDQPGGPTFPGSGDPGVPYWAGLRQSFGANSFTGGVISATSDETTSQTMTLPDWAASLTISDLQNLKDPYGRAYLAIAQSSGSLWGVT